MKIEQWSFFFAFTESPAKRFAFSRNNSTTIEELLTEDGLSS